MATDLFDKETIWNTCRNHVLRRIETAEQAMAAANAASQDDTKSSAGDKFETGREMMQQEMNRHGQLLAEARSMQYVLESISYTSRHDTAKLGSVVHTDRGVFYLSIGLGLLAVNGEKLYAISISAPIGKLLMGGRSGDKRVFNNVAYSILHVY